MSNHSIVRAGLGLGLMAASLGASAQLHTFAEPMIYYKVNGSAVTYVAFLPKIDDAAVVVIDLYQSGTISTWAFGIGAAPDAAAGGALWSYSASNSTQSNNAGSFTNKFYNGVGQSSGVNWGTTSTGVSQNASSSWYGGDTQSVSMAFAQDFTISSQVCNVTYTVNIGTDDVMRYVGFNVAASGFQTASDSVSWRTKSGTSATDTASSGSAAWNALANFSVTRAFPTFTFSAFSIPNAANGATQTVAATGLTKGNLCTNVYTNKNALNSAGNVIGGATGLIRLW